METENKQSKLQLWGTFLFFSALSVLSFYYNVWSGLGGLFFLIFAVISFPNDKFQVWLKELGDKASGWAAVVFMYVLYIGVFVAIGFGVYWLFSFVFGDVGKYEGMTAEEWADEYYAENENYVNFRNCVEEYDSFDLRTQIEYGGVFYYCE